MTQIVFIGGAGRSGTTFLAHQLALYDGISTGNENQWMVELIEQRVPSDRFVDFCRKHWKIRTAPCIPTSAEWRDIQRVAEFEGRSQAIIALMRILAAGSKIIVDHTPWNLARTHVIRRAFPSARYLHIVRDGRAVYASLKRVTWGPNTPPAAAAYWESAVARGVLAESDPNYRVERVYYEDLLSRSGTSQRLASRLLDVSPEDLSLRAAPAVTLARYTRRQHSLVNSPPEQKRSRAWENELSSREIAAFEQIAGATLSLLNYQLKTEKVTSPSHVARLAWSAEEFLKSGAVNPLRNIIRTRGQHLI